MTIQYHGDACVRITGKTNTGEFTVLCDPYDAKATGLKPLRPSSVDIVCSTTGALPDFGAGPHRITGPGEYEARGVMVTGFAVSGRTVYRIEAEGIAVAHFGNLAVPLDDATVDALGDIHVLLMPVGGKTPLRQGSEGQAVLTAKQAGELMERIEPRVVIPLQYAVAGSKLAYEGIEAFCKIAGCSTKGAEEKLKLTKKELPAEELWAKVLAVT